MAIDRDKLTQAIDFDPAAAGIACIHVAALDHTVAVDSAVAKLASDQPFHGKGTSASNATAFSVA
jgi:hypothetical protein